MNIPECKHYKRESLFVAPCCKKLYICRLCHDANETHKVNRTNITTLCCKKCNKLQKVATKCDNCGVLFGSRYACLTCKLFDNEDKGQFHCDKCEICRVGSRAKFFHCDKCNICLAVGMIGKHRCVENASRRNCPICVEDMHSSTIPLHIPDCGHYLHEKCYKQLLESGIYACPICQDLLLNP